MRVTVIRIISLLRLVLSKVRTFFEKQIPLFASLNPISFQFALNTIYFVFRWMTFRFTSVATKFSSTSESSDSEQEHEAEKKKDNDSDSEVERVRTSSRKVKGVIGKFRFESLWFQNKVLSLYQRHLRVDYIFRFGICCWSLFKIPNVKMFRKMTCNFRPKLTEPRIPMTTDNQSIATPTPESLSMWKTSFVRCWPILSNYGHSNVMVDNMDFRSSSMQDPNQIWL